MGSEIIFTGIAASPGIGVGPVFLLEKEELVIHRKSITKDDVKKEILRFRTAIQKTVKEMKHDREEMLHALGKSHARLADAYLMILEDPILTKDIEREITKEQLNAEFVIQEALEKISYTFDALSDDYFRDRKNDILEVGDKILRHLLGKEKTMPAEMEQESIVAAHNLLPSDTIALKTHLIRGFAINVGGKTSHTALLAQSLEIPAVVGLKDITAQLKSGDTLIIDGNHGKVILNPEPETLKNYLKERESQIRKMRELVKLKDLPATTEDGKRVELAANIETSEDIRSVLAHGAEGIGLFRTEYLFMNRESLPTEEEQFEHYVKVVKQVKPHATLFRTLDIGGDKLSPFIEGFAREENPFLGLRAIRFSLKYPGIFKTQLRALLRASHYGKVRIMFPMVSGLQDFVRAREFLNETRRELMKQDIPVAAKIEVGAMIEVPSAALTADQIAREADFLSIGTNDLIQYTLAVDRVNENVANLYEPMHPSILRLIKMSADAAHAHGRWIGMCGEMAANLELTLLLLGLGLDELSVVPSFVPKIKKLIRSSRLSEAKKLADAVMASDDPALAGEHLKKFSQALL